MARGFNLTAEINLRGPANIRTIVADIRRQLGTVTADVNVRVNPSVGRSINTLNQALQRLNTNLQNTRTFSNQAVNALNSLANIGNRVNTTLTSLPRNVQAASTAVNTLTRNTNNAAQATQSARTEFEEFGRQSALAVRRFAAFAFVTGAIYKVNNAIASGAKEFLAFNKELVRVSQVTGTSVKNLDFLVSKITNLSTSLGVTSQDLIQVSSTLAQAGLSARDTEKALRALALSALAPSFDSLSDTVEGSIALMRQFGISAGDLEKALGSVNSVAAKFAVEAGDIITAIQRTGGVFAAASRGVSEGTDALNEFIAVFTSVRQTTRESAETIATGLRTIFTRIQRGDTIEALKQYGVALTDLEGKFVGPFEAVRRLAEGLNQLDPRDLRFSRIVEELGGFRQIGKVIPLIQQFTVAQQALVVAQRGQGSLAEDAAVAQQALANKISKVKEEFVSLIRSVGQSDSFQSFISLSLDLASALIKIADSAKNVLPALTAIAAIRGTSFLAQFATGFAGGLRRSQPARGFAAGGYVPGTGNRDTVPAMLTPGEFVIRKKAVEKIGVGSLARLNRNNGGPVPTQYFNAGGPVQHFEIGGEAKKKKGIDWKSLSKGRGKKGARGPRGRFDLPQPGDADFAKWQQEIYAEYDADPSLTRVKHNGIPMPPEIAYANQLISEEVFGAYRRKKSGKLKKTPLGLLISAAKMPRGQRAPAGEMEKIMAGYQQSPEFQKETSGAGSSLFSTLKGPLSSFKKGGNFGGVIAPGSENATKIKGALEKLLAQSSGQDAIKAKTALDKFDSFIAGGTPEKPGHVSHFTWAMNQIFKKGIATFGRGGIASRRMGVFDFDMTTGVTKQKETPSLSGFRDPKLAVPDILSATPTGLVEIMKKYGAAQILTARSGGPKGEMTTALGAFFRKNGLILPSTSITTLGDQLGGLSTPEKKARALHDLVKKYGGVDFFDDDPTNIDAAKMVRGVNAKRVALRKNLGGIIQKFNVGGSVEEQILSDLKGSDGRYRFGIAALRSGTKQDSKYRMEQFPLDLTKKQKGKKKQDLSGPSGSGLISDKKIDVDLHIGTLSSIANKTFSKRIEKQIVGQLQESMIMTAQNIGQELGVKTIGASEQKKILSGTTLSSAVGSVYEGALGLLGSPYIDKTESIKSIDFPRGMGPLAEKFFGSSGLSNMPTDATRTYAGAGKNASDFKKQIKRFIGALNRGEFTKAENKQAQKLAARAFSGSPEGKALKAIEQAWKGTGISAKVKGALTSNEIFDQVRGSVPLPRAFGSNRGTFRKTMQRLYQEEEAAKQGKYTGPVTSSSQRLSILQSVAGAVAAGENPIQKNNLGGMIQKFATGGSAEDKVPALLTPGEFVINKRAAKSIGSARLNKLNHADKIKGFNKGGSVGFVQRFAKGGSPEKLGEAATSLPTIPDLTRTAQQVEQALEALINNVGNAASRVTSKLTADPFDPKGYAQTQKQVESATSPQASLGLRQKADTGDQNAANMVADAQRKQVNSLVRVIRAHDNSISVTQAKAAAERRVADAWGGLYRRTKEQEQQSSLLSRAMSKATALYSRMRGSNLDPDQQRANREARASRNSRIAQAGIGLAFTAPMIADQLGQAMGGTKGAGISEGTAAFSTFAGIGSQFGIIGTFVGALAGAVAAVDGYTKGVLKAENELSKANIEKEAETAEKTVGRLERDPRNKALTDSLVSSLDKMSTEEANLQRRNAELRAPTTLGKIGAGLQTAASYATFGLVSEGRVGPPKMGTPEYDKFVQEIGQTNAAQSKSRSDAAIKALSAKGSQGLTIEEALGSFGGDAAKIQESIAAGNVQYATELEKLSQLASIGAISATELEQRKKGLIQKYYLQETEGLKAAMADKARANASQKVARALNVAVTSIDRTFGNMEAALNRGSDALANASTRLEAVASGSASLQSSFSGQNILENPRAYSRAERTGAVRQAAGAFGPDMAVVERLSSVGNQIKDSITSIGARSLSQGTSKEATAQEVQRTVDRQLEAAFGNNDLTRQLSEQVRIAISDQLKDTESEDLDIDKLLSEATGLTSIIESEKKAFELLAQATKQASQAIDLYSSQVQKATDILNELDNINAEGVAMRASNDFRLREMFGQKIPVRERLASRRDEAAARAGIKPDQFNLNALVGRLQTLRQTRAGVEDRRDRFQGGQEFTDPKTVESIGKFNASLINLNNQVDKTKNALKNLPRDIQGAIDDVAGAIQERLSKVETQKQAGAGFAEKLATSTPDELRDINNTYNILNGALNGQVRTIQQSVAAQQAYQKTINDGGTAVEAMSAAQNAFANENRQAFGMFSELIDVAGIDKQQGNVMRADLLESMARSQGMNMQNNPIFNKIVENLRRPPGDDPEIKRLQTLYKQLQDTQQKALEANRQIVLEDSSNLIKSAGEEVKKAIETARISFNEQQLNDIGLGLSRPSQVMGKAKGGVVYASAGQLINFQPRGTDTVPAMLTPGEFVVNARATKQNLPLLQSINKSSGGKVSYFNKGTVNPVGTTGSTKPSGPSIQYNPEEYIDFHSEKYKGTPQYDEARKLLRAQAEAYSWVGNANTGTTQRAEANANWKRFRQLYSPQATSVPAPTLSATPSATPVTSAATASAAAPKPPTNVKSAGSNPAKIATNTAAKPTPLVNVTKPPTSINNTVDDVIADVMEYTAANSPNGLPPLRFDFDLLTDEDRISIIREKVLEKWNSIIASPQRRSVPVPYNDLVRSMRADFAQQLVDARIIDSADKVKFQKPIMDATETFTDTYAGFPSDGSAAARGGPRSRILPNNASFGQRFGAYAGDLGETARGFGNRIGSGLSAGSRMLGQGLSAARDYAGNVIKFANSPFAGREAAEGIVGGTLRGLTRLGLGAGYVGVTGGLAATRGLMRGARGVGTSLFPVAGLNAASEMLGFGSLSNESATLASFGIDAIQGGVRSVLPQTRSFLPRVGNALINGSGLAPRSVPGATSVAKMAGRIPGVSTVSNMVGRGADAVRGSRAVGTAARAANTIGSIGGGGVGTFATAARGAAASAVAVNTALSAVTEGVSFLYDREGYSNRLAAEEESEYANAKDQSAARYAAGQALSGFTNPFRMFAKFGRATYSTSQAAANNQAQQQASDTRNLIQRQDWSMGGRIQMIEGNEGYFSDPRSLASWVPARAPVYLDTLTGKKYDSSKPAEANAFNTMLSQDRLAGFSLTGAERGWVQAKVDLEDKKARGLFQKNPEEYEKQKADLEARRNTKTDRYERGYLWNTVTQENLLQSSNLDAAVAAEQTAIRQEREAKAQEAAEIARQQKIAQDAETFIQGVETTANLAMQGVGFVSGLWNQGSNFLESRQKQAAQKTRMEEAKRLADLSESASSALKSPALPEYVDDFKKYSDTRVSLFKQLQELENFQLGGTMAERDAARPELQQEKANIRRQITELDSTIVKKQREGSRVPYEDRKKQWEKYNTGIEKDRVKEEKREINLALKKEAALYENLEKVTRMRIPRDPEKLADWRAKALEKIRQKFDLSGDPSADIDMMTAYGLSPELAKNLFRPMTEQQNEAVYDLLSQQTQGGEYKYSDQDLQLLRISRQELIKRVSDGRVARPQDLIRRKEQLETAREKEFGKSVKTMSKIDMLAQRGMSANPRAQQRFRKNIYKKLVKSGFIDPRDNAQTNAQRLSALNLGANTVSFVYPNQAGGMLAQMKSSGGMIYASAGKLINFQPKGTDTVPAMLTPGEFVVNARSTKQNLPLLQAINKADGGFIGAQDATVTSAKIRADQSTVAAQRQTLSQLQNVSRKTSNIDSTTKNINNQQLPTLNNKTSSYQKENFGLLNNIKGTSNEIVKNTRYTAETLAPLNLSTGGVVYASKGTLVPFQPKGTDTVPAMLTPGEFVVNRSATQANLPLLQAINGGAKGFATGGQVNYMSGGGFLGQLMKPMMTSFTSLTSSITNTIQALQNYQKQLAGTQPNSVSNTSGRNINLDGLSEFTTKFDQFIVALNSINIPPMVQLQVAPVTVNITGAEALVKALQGPMGEMLQGQIAQAFSRLSANTEGAIPV